MDEVDSVQLYAASNDVCERCGMHVGEGMGCCRDEVSIIKIEDDQKFSQFSFQFEQQQPAITIPSEFISFNFYNFSFPSHYLNHSPPLLSGEDTYLQNCVFRI
jgi:hypothetical protein